MNNLRAFLDTIAVSELGYSLIAISDNGYNVIVGSTPAHPILFHNYSDHPRQLIQITPMLKSTAAGRYQILKGIFDAYKKQLGLLDFGHESQDAIAVQLLRERDALLDIKAGRFDIAARKAASAWASLPGAGYGQRENTLASLRNSYIQAGGALA